MSLRSIKIYPGHENVREVKSNAAGVRSRGLLVSPPNNVFLVVERGFQPVMKLFTAAGDQIDPATQVFIGKKRPGETSPTYLPGSFTYQSFYDLTTAQQRDRNNAATLLQDLGQGLALREQEEMHIEFLGPDAIDWDQPGTAFEFNAGWAAQ